MVTMVKKRVAELECAQLDWAVAVAACEPLSCDAWQVPTKPGTIPFVMVGTGNGDKRVYYPSSSWADGGPIIERERICIEFLQPGRWVAYPRTEGGINARVTGKTWSVYCEDLQSATPLVAAMRAFVASKLGDEVEVPA